MSKIYFILKLIYLLFFLPLFFFCSNKEPVNKKAITQPKVESSINKTSKPKIESSTEPTENQLKYSSGIRSILQDSKGNFWFGSHQEGVCFFDGKTYTYFTTDDSLGDNQVRTIQESEDGTIWFGTANGVSSFKHGKIKNHTPKDFFPSDTFSKNNWGNTSSDLWFAAGNKAGVYKFDGKKLNYISLPIPEDTNSYNHYTATGFSKGKNGYIWIATYSALFGYDGISFNVNDNKFLGYKEQQGQLHIRSILEDSKGNVWIGNNGIGVLLKNELGIINFSKKMGLIHAESTGGGEQSPQGTLEHIFAIQEDRQGNIWFGDRDTGAWKYDGKTMTNYPIEGAPTTQHIWDYYQDKNGEWLAAVDDGGIYKFNGKSFEKKY